MEPSAYNQTKYRGNMVYFRIKLDTENASLLRVERRGEQQMDVKQTSCDLCAFRTRGTFPVFWIRRDNLKQMWVFILM